MNDFDARMRVRLLDCDGTIMLLEFLLHVRQVVWINPPKQFNVLKYLVILVGQLDMVSDDIVPPIQRSPTTSTSQVGRTHHLSKLRGGTCQ